MDDAPNGSLQRLMRSIRFSNEVVTGIMPVCGAKWDEGVACDSHNADYTATHLNPLNAGVRGSGALYLELKAYRITSSGCKTACQREDTFRYWCSVFELPIMSTSCSLSRVDGI